MLTSTPLVEKEGQEANATLTPGSIPAFLKDVPTEQIKTLTSAIERYDIPFDDYPPTVLMVLMTGATQVLVQEQTLGMVAGHEETVRFAHKWLAILEGERLPDDDWRTGRV